MMVSLMMLSGKTDAPEVQAAREAVERVLGCFHQEMVVGIWPSRDLPRVQDVDAMFLGPSRCAFRWSFVRGAVHAYGPAARLFMFRMPRSLVALSPLRQDVVWRMNVVLVTPYGFGPEVARHTLRVAAVLARQRAREVTVVSEDPYLLPVEEMRALLREEAPEVVLDFQRFPALIQALLRYPEVLNVVLVSGKTARFLFHTALAVMPSPGLVPQAYVLAQPNKHGHFWGIYGPVPHRVRSMTERGMENPLASMLAVAWMLRLSLGLEDAAYALEQAIFQTLDEGWRTVDIATDQEPIPTRQMVREVLRRLCPEPEPRQNRSET